ncbi:hypothetical protein Taro_038179 [Colocasia esculenta]|uniref:Uncharacterized protein n=1 Tax=Colocasia esculenta TaxID=4460 RepID=A0A843W2P1_COLES|nr:hypothetical protein [Colocasia esculenta]
MECLRLVPARGGFCGGLAVCAGVGSEGLWRSLWMFGWINEGLEIRRSFPVDLCFVDLICVASHWKKNQGLLCLGS